MLGPVIVVVHRVVVMVAGLPEGLRALQTLAVLLEDGMTGSRVKRMIGARLVGRQVVLGRLVLLVRVQGLAKRRLRLLLLLVLHGRWVLQLLLLLNHLVVVLLRVGLLLLMLLL